MSLADVEVGDEADLSGADGETEDALLLEFRGELRGGAESFLHAEDDDVSVHYVGGEGQAVRLAYGFC